MGKYTCFLTALDEKCGDWIYHSPSWEEHRWGGPNSKVTHPVGVGTFHSKSRNVNLLMVKVEENSMITTSSMDLSSRDIECLQYRLYQLADYITSNVFPVFSCISEVMTDAVQFQAWLIMLPTALFPYEHFVTKEDKSAVSLNTKWARTKRQQCIILLI